MPHWRTGIRPCSSGWPELEPTAAQQLSSSLRNSLQVYGRAQGVATQLIQAGPGVGRREGLESLGAAAGGDSLLHGYIMHPELANTALQVALWPLPCGILLGHEVSSTLALHGIGCMAAAHESSNRIERNFAGPAPQARAPRCCSRISTTRGNVLRPPGASLATANVGARRARAGQRRDITPTLPAPTPLTDRCCCAQGAGAGRGRGRRRATRPRRPAASAGPARARAAGTPTRTAARSTATPTPSRRRPRTCAAATTLRPPVRPTTHRPPAAVG